jgi:serine/threonine protein kinase
MERIMCCEYNFSGIRWKKASIHAKEFVRELLVLDPEDRPTADEALGNLWLNRRYSATVRAPTVEEVNQSTKSLQAFAGYSKLKKLVSVMLCIHMITE